MATIQKSTSKSNSNRINNTISGTTLSSWSRQQKFALIACFALLGLLLALSACSDQSPKPALVSVSSPATASSATAPAGVPVTASTTAVAPATAKKASRKRPANVSYSDPNSRVSFLYPRKSALTSGEKAQPQFADVDVPMNFIQPGGSTVATVTLPTNSYPGTDFESAFFSVNVNRNVSEQECSHFAFVDTSNPDGEPVDAEEVTVGSTDMERTSDFTASALNQAEAQYYHSYNNGSCYEYVLGLGTGGYGVKDGIEPVNRDEVFARLEKILATVTIKDSPVEPVAEQAATGIASGKE